MKRMYFFSIIIPTFNSENTIGKCLKSIYEQEFEDFEVIIIDGKSTDETLSIISAFKNHNTKVFSEIDEGIYDAMNKGIDLANGKFIYFLGSDDTLFNPQVLKNINYTIDSKTDKIIYGNVKMNGTNKWVKDGTVYGGEFNLKRILSHNIPHQAIFYHYSVFDILGKFNLRYPIFADHDFNIKAFSQYLFKYTELIVADFFVGGASTTKSDHFAEDRIANIVQYFKKDLAGKTFVPLRYYVHQAAFNSKVKIDVSKKFYFSLIYFKLKIQALFN